MSLLNGGGTPILNGTLMAGNKNGFTAANLPSANSPYFVQVYGDFSGTNNYQLYLEVTGP